MTRSLKKTLNEKKTAFCRNDQVEGKRIQTKLKKEIKAAKIAYREKVEFQFQSGNMPWKGIQTPTGETKTKACSDGLSQKEKKDHCECEQQLNTFHCRFDEKHNHSVEISYIKAELLQC